MKKSVLGLILFSCLTITGLFVGVSYLINQGEKVSVEQNQSYTADEGIDTSDYLAEDGKDYHIVEYTDSNDNAEVESIPEINASGGTAGTDSENQSTEANMDLSSSDTNKLETDKSENSSSKINSTEKTSEKRTVENNSTDNLELNMTTDINETAVNSKATNNNTNAVEGSTESSSINVEVEEPWLITNPSDIGSQTNASQKDTTEALSGTVKVAPELQLIDSSNKEYKDYIPKMTYDSSIETALDIKNPSISIKAEAAILFDAETKNVLYHKNAVEAIFPASTAKLLTSLVALDWCEEDEKVKLGDEVKMIASDSSKAGVRPGEILTIRNLLEGMLLPSGNDAAYGVAVYVGKKSLQDSKASNEAAVIEFGRLMNQKAKDLGAKNSCFKTPDGYDALGQYTTAYDIGLIGLEALENKTIMEISKKSKSRNVFVSGRDVTWENTNKLIQKGHARYYSHAIGLKTGTSGLAGKCLVSAGKYNGRVVLSVVMDSNTSGRWEDSISLLKYGLNR